MIGFIQLHRKLLEWEWYTDQKTFKLFLHCLLKANFKDKDWRGKTIKRGQFVTSISHLSSETGLSIKQVRTALENLESTGEVDKQTTNLNTWITILYYDKYQSEGKPLDKPTDKPRANKGQQLNKDNNDKELKEDNNKPTAFNFRNSFLELGVDNDILNDWLAVRKKKKGVNSETAFKGFVNEVKKSNLTIPQAVEICASKSWASFNASWDIGKDLMPKEKTKQQIYEEQLAEVFKNKNQ